MARNHETDSAKPDHLTAPAAAAEAGCSLRTLNRAVADGRIPVAGRRGGTGIRYINRADLLAWMLGRGAANEASPVVRKPPARRAAPSGDALERIARAAAGGGK